ncbi:hypothetical protein [Massilia glaciei]|uniref:DUF1090 domain-containing protein n=1 Tax=Massilia glaciei TaxID=1524097 RepID=A0A2U2HF11_9BURK|nr:hypothetical protein [Massilia glaciei]PWF42504.1 hypothetical protein C7C56_022590 [Massilia glaciei]
MSKTVNRLSGLLIASALLSLANPAAIAQKPGAAKAGNDKVMTREELRSCMKLKAANLAHVKELNDKLDAHGDEREKLLAATPVDTGKGLREEAGRQLEIVKAADALVVENSKQIDAWNERMAEFHKNKKDMRQAFRKEQELKAERNVLQAKNDGLIADRTAKVAVYEASVAAANAAIVQTGSGNEEWNKRNKELALEEAQLKASRQRYTDDCASRRFREDDEKAINAGK